jgi:16S rRNA C967 or C1407 C5-methylase (RsmB/RsmF family)/NOL1/NOP2/fmu family ribosome biogenesis protein
MKEFPVEFVMRMRRELGEVSCEKLLESLNAEAPVSIRLNPIKVNRELSFARVPWCDSGYYLPHRPAFTYDPRFHAGAYYVQEASSMFLERVIKSFIKTQVTCLDLCAAPGGKSTHLQSLLPAGSLLVSNESNTFRCNVLLENNLKWGYPNVIITNSGADELGRLAQLFDVILADMPCSGEGMFRKDLSSRELWSESLVRERALLQRRLIKDSWSSLKPGGLLIYSTCTFNHTENEENVSYIVSSMGASLERVEGVEGEPYAYDSALGPVYRFYPHEVKGEGFFMAILRKPDERIIPIRRDRMLRKPSFRTPREITPWLRGSASPRTYIPFGRDISVLDSVHSDSYLRLSSTLRIISAGLPLGCYTGNRTKPSAALAMSVLYNRGIFPELELSYLDAIHYLQRDAIAWPIGSPRSTVLVTYKGYPLGFVNAISRHANNLYPKEWRIRRRLLD